MTARQLTDELPAHIRALMRLDSLRQLDRITSDEYRRYREAIPTWSRSLCLRFLSDHPAPDPR